MSFKYIEYQYPIAHVFHKEIFWVDKNCNVYFAFKLLESDDWVYYAGDASHALKTGNILTRYDSEASAVTNYLTTAKDSNNKVLAVLPLNFQAKYARIYIEEGSSVTIHEWIPSVYLTANEIIAGELLISDKLSDAPIIRVVSNLIDRLKMGNVGGSYGIFGYDSSGNLIFELSDNAQTIGGWTFTQTSLSCISGESGILLDAAGAKIESTDYTTGSMGKGWHLGPDKIEVNAAEIRGSVIKGSIFYKEAISAVGGELLVAEADSLDADMTANDSETLTIKGGITLAVNDVVRIKADDGNDEWIQITGIGSAPTYNITRDKASAYASNNNPAWKAGSAVINYGISGEGVVRVSASDTNAPFLEVITHAGQPWTDSVTKARFGCLDGYLGCSGESFGFGVGIEGVGQANLLYTSRDGLRIKSNNQDRMTFDHAGNAWISNNLTLGRTGVASGVIRLELWDGHGDTYIAAGKTDFTNVESGFILGLDDSDSNKAKFYIGNSDSYLNWDGSSLSVSGKLSILYKSFGGEFLQDVQPYHMGAQTASLFTETKSGSGTVTWAGHSTTITMPAGSTAGSIAGVTTNATPVGHTDGGFSLLLKINNRTSSGGTTRIKFDASYTKYHASFEHGYGFYFYETGTIICWSQSSISNYTMTTTSVSPSGTMTMTAFYKNGTIMFYINSTLVAVHSFDPSYDTNYVTLLFKQTTTLGTDGSTEMAILLRRAQAWGKLGSATFRNSGWAGIT